MTEEIWKDIPNAFGHYQASSLGRIRSVKRTIVYSNGQVHNYPEKILIPHLVNGGYLGINIGGGKNKREAGVHRLVAEAFYGRPDTPMDVNHINGIKTDNRITNLEFVTRKENMWHCKNVLKKVAGREKTSIRCVETREVFESLTDAHNKTGANIGHLSEVVNKKSSRTIVNGKHWELV